MPNRLISIASEPDSGQPPAKAPRKNRRPMLKRLIALACGLIFAVLALEGGIRILAPQKPAPEVMPKEGFQLPANTRFHSKSDEWDVWIQTNSLGFHDQDHDPAPKPDRLRILVLGDSFAEVNQVTFEQTWWTVMKEKLWPHLPMPLEVIAMGLGGAGTAREMFLYEKFGGQFEPNIVLLAFCLANDVFNNSPKLEDKLDKGLFYLPENGKLVPVHGERFEALTAKAWWPLWRLSHLYRFIGRRLYIKEEEERRLREAGGYPIDYQIFLEEPPAKWEEAWEITRLMIQELDQKVRARQGRLIVLGIPAKEQIYEEDWRTVLKQWPKMEQQRWNLSAPNRKLADILKQAGVPYLDLLPGIQAAAEETPEERLYFRKDIHWTVLGNEKVGELIAEFLRLQPSLNSSALSAAAES